MTTAQQFQLPYNEEGAKLRILVTNKILTGLLEHLDPADIEPDQLCKLAHTFCEIRKQDAACEKNIASIEVAKIKTTAAPQSKNQAPHGDDNEEALYGRKPDGTPHTRAEFLKDLKQAVQDIYGFTEEQATTLIDGSQNAPRPHSPDRDDRFDPIAPAMGKEAKQKNSPDRGDRFQPIAQAMGKKEQHEDSPVGTIQCPTGPRPTQRISCSPTSPPPNKGPSQ